MLFAPLSLACLKPVRANGGLCPGKGKEYRSLSQESLRFLGKTCRRRQGRQAEDCFSICLWAASLGKADAMQPPSGEIKTRSSTGLGLPAAVSSGKMKFDYSRIYDFENLYRAYLASRRNKRSTREVIQFEMNAGPNLCRLQEEVRSGTYRLSGYYHFTIHDPKTREIYALHYRDRILQHSLCDNLLAPYFEKHLIYDNAACRKNKGTLFAMNRLNGFLHEHFKHHGRKGYFLKCDIRKFFDSIDHTILKRRLTNIVDDVRTLELLFHIIDSYEVSPGRGIPMGNQTSQWFALFYLDPLDRLVKEKLKIKYYTRYMDDCILISESKEELHYALIEMRKLLAELCLSFNEKTQIFPITHGVEYLGWRFALTETGRVTRRLKKHSKYRWQHRLRKLSASYSKGLLAFEKVQESVQSYRNHMHYGDTYRLYGKTMKHFALKRDVPEYEI